MATQVTVTGTLKDAAGGNMSGTVTFTPSQPLYDADGSLIVTRAPVVATLSSGAFTATIYATDDPNTSPEGATYLIEEELTDSNSAKVTRRYRAEIPYTDTTLRYEDITEAIPARAEHRSYASLAALTSHYGGITAHDAADITYTGAVAGASTVEEGLDTLESSKTTAGYVDAEIAALTALSTAAIAAVDLNDVVEPASNWRHVDDMVGGSATSFPSGWTATLSGAGAVVGDAAVAQKLPGARTLGTGTTSTGLALAALDTVQIEASTLGATWWRVRCPVIDNPATDDWTVYVGMIQGLLTTGYYFTASPGTDNWQAVTNNGATTTADSGVAINTGGGAGSWVWLKMERTASSVIFSIDGTVVATTTTTLPTTQLVRPFVGIAKSVGTTSRVVQVDTFAADMTLARGTMG